MATKPRPAAVVAFYATSDRVAAAYRAAAKRNPLLAQRATLHPDSTPSRNVKRAVVLSYLTGGSVGRLTGEFHLLFAGPDTPHDEVLRWTHATRVKPDDRLHVVADDADSHTAARLLGRVCSAFVTDGRLIDAYATADELVVRGPMFRVLRVPFAAVPALRTLPADARRRFELDPDGSFLYWPAGDIHLGWDQLLQAVDPTARLRAQQQTRGHNEQYGAAIRTLRDRAGLTQAQIAGITPRHLSRVETGVQPATVKVLSILATAHGLAVNDYMDRVAKAMR